MMRGRRRLRHALARGALLALALAGCYDVPKPECGFRCGPNEACPEDYTCSRSDGRCHLDGAPPSLVCGAVDAALDAPPDAPLADAAADAPVADAAAR